MQALRTKVQLSPLPDPRLTKKVHELGAHLLGWVLSWDLAALAAGTMGLQEATVVRREAIIVLVHLMVRTRRRSIRKAALTHLRLTMANTRTHLTTANTHLRRLTWKDNLPSPTLKGLLLHQALTMAPALWAQTVSTGLLVMVVMHAQTTITVAPVAVAVGPLEATTDSATAALLPSL